jgi:hypothetical protein
MFIKKIKSFIIIQYNNLTLNKIRFLIWFIVGFTGACLSPFISPFIIQFITFVTSCIVVFWSFSWLYE